MTDPLAPLRALPHLRLAPIANILDNPPLQVRFWHETDIDPVIVDVRHRG